MFARRLAGHSLVARACLLVAIVMPGTACVGTGERLRSWNGSATTEETIQLPAAEQMIDELDRVMTAYGTISVKTPDVWGQDRLAKFRSEYESQMAGWLKVGFKGDINASVQRSESDSTIIQVGTERIRQSAKHCATPARRPPSRPTVRSSIRSTRSGPRLDAGVPASKATVDNPAASLEPTVVLDEHSNYLNHLNQLRRINAGDDLADRPGYGLYLVRIPVTLSPGPRSRRGKGAIITVSAKSVMTKHTLRDALRNAVINETVNNLTQAICASGVDRLATEPGRPTIGAFSLVSFADTELFYGRTNIDLLRDEAERQLARELGDEPHHRRRGSRSGSERSWSRRITSSRRLRRPSVPAGPPRPSIRSKSSATRSPGGISPGSPRCRSDRSNDAEVKTASDRAAHRDAGRAGAAAKRVVSILSFALRIQAAGVNRRLKQDMADQDPTLDRRCLKQHQLLRAGALRRGVARLREICRMPNGRCASTRSSR